MFAWLKSITADPTPTEDDNKPTPAERAAETESFSTHAVPNFDMKAKLSALKALAPTHPVVTLVGDGSTGGASAMDEFDAACCDTGYDAIDQGQPVSDALVAWYGSQTFIGYQLAALVAQHWLVRKACDVPARDAIRNGFDIVTSDGDDVPEDLLKYLKRADKRYGLMRNLLQYVAMGRVFGIRICLFKVKSTDPDYYTKPFNIDSVTEGSYQGMVQVDPYWCSPMLDGPSASQPDTMHFYEPTWWQINGKRYHRSHLVIFRNGEVADILKPQYLYGGLPVPQLVMERIYGAERTANEAPLLAMTKRTMVLKTDTAQVVANYDKTASRLTFLQRLWSNFGTRLIDEGDELTQIDTSLSDMDAVIMTQYQLVAAAAEMPATKLLGTSVKGFNATGEYDESVYHETLESMQTHDLSPLVDRHHQLCLASAPAALREAHKGVLLETSWQSLDTPTAKELAEINKIDAEADAALVGAGSIDGTDSRRRIATNRLSNYSGIAVASPAEPLPDDPATPAAPVAATTGV